MLFPKVYPSILFDIIIIIIGVVLLIVTQSHQVSACSIVLNDNVCPIGVPEDAPSSTLPTTCSSRGSCVLGACDCNPGWSDVDCSRLERRLVLGTMAITQAGFDEAPARYLDFVVKAFERFKASNLEIPPAELHDCLNYIAKTPLVPNWAISIELDYSSLTAKIVEDGIKITAHFDIAIPHIPIDAYVSTTPGSGTCCLPGDVPLFLETATCTEACTSLNGEFASVSFTASLAMTVLPFINETSQRVQAEIQPGSIVVDLAPPDLNLHVECDLSAYPQLLFDLFNNYVQPWGDLLRENLESAFVTEVQQAAEDMSVGTARNVNVTNSTHIEVFVTTLEFYPNSHIAMNLEGYVRKRRFSKDLSCPAIWTTYADRDEDALLPVPIDFNGFEEETSDGLYTLQTLIEGRISRSALRALVWGVLLDETELVTSLTSYVRSFGLLDAVYNGRIGWALPTFEFPIARASNGSQQVRNTIRIVIPFGDTEMVCNNTGISQLSTIFARVTLDMKPIALGNFTANLPGGEHTDDPTFALTGQITDWDTSHVNMNITSPQKLSIPNALMKILAEEFMKSKLDVANELLRIRAPLIPSNLMRFVPGPRLEAVHDYENEGRDSGNGYIEASTRCVCASASDPPYLIVPTNKFDNEIIPKCFVTACSRRRRRMLEIGNAVVVDSNSNDELSVSVDKIESPPQQLLLLSSASAEEVITSLSVDGGKIRQEYKRRKLDAFDDLAIFAQSGRCGPVPFNLDEFREELSLILECATVRDSNSFVIHNEATAIRYACMERKVPGICDPDSAMMREYGGCAAPMSAAIPASFTGKPCVEGKAFACSDTLSDIIDVNCRCSKADRSLWLVAECNENFIPGLILASGLLVPFIIYGVVLCVICCKCRDNGETLSDLRAALGFRVKRRQRDLLLINMAFFASAVFILVVSGWVLQDPLKSFAKNIVSSDLFRLSPEISTDFEAFMVGWSSAILFFMAFGASQFLVISILSLVTGRCIWLKPLPKYIRNNRWVVPPLRITIMWYRIQRSVGRLIRCQSVLIVVSLAIPPLFFPFRFSVSQVQPQFGETFIDDTFDLAANLTSLTTSTEYMDTLVSVIGFALMSSAIGFISSGVIYIFHGAAPGCFAAAQVMIYLMDRKEARDREAYAQFKSLLPPPDNSELDRWRRVVFLFVWCFHAAGALGSSVAAILLYQVLRASSGWAIVWLLNWVLPLPIIYMSTSKRHRNRHGLLAFAYTAIFAICTVVMIFLAPESAGFSNWLGVLLVVAVFCCVFLILLSEFLNVADRINSGKHKKQGITMKDGEDNIVADDDDDDGYVEGNNYDNDDDVGKAMMLQTQAMEKMQKEKKRMVSLVFDSKASVMTNSKQPPQSPKQQQATMMANASPLQVGNPLFEHEKQKIKGGSHAAAFAGARPAPPPPPPSSPPGASSTLSRARLPQQQQQQQEQEMSDHDMMKIMASPSYHGNHNGSSGIISSSIPAQSVRAQAMAEAAERLRRKVNRLSMVQGLDENDIIATFKQAENLQKQQQAREQQQEQQQQQQKQQQQHSKASAGLLQSQTAMSANAALTKAQQLEKERLRRRISKRLAARGLAGTAAKDLAERIADYHAMKMAVERQQRMLERANKQHKSMRPGAGAMAPLVLPQAQVPANQKQPNAAATMTRSGMDADQMRKQQQQQPLPPARTLEKKKPSDKGLSSQGSSGTLPIAMQRSPSLEESRLLAATASSSSLLASPRSPTGQRAPLSPKPVNPKLMKGLSDFSTSGSPQPQPAPIARAQAQAHTANATLDDVFAAQFDPDYDGPPRNFNGDDSFFGFVREVASQLKKMIGSAIKTVRDDYKDRQAEQRQARVHLENERYEERQRQIRRRPKARAATYHHERFLKEAREGAGGSRIKYSINRFRSRVARFFNERVRPFIRAIADVVQEKRETDDPATYGLRVPGRRMMFIQGLVLMLILLVNVGFNRVSVNKLKDEAMQVIMATSPVGFDPEAGYNWPGLDNVTEVFDVPLAAYVDRATDAYVLMWVIFVLWLLSLIVEVIYAVFGRDMEEKRKGIKLARNISFINLPLLLLAVVLPCAPDYVGLSIGGISDLIPECAPKLTAATVGVASNLFGVFAGTYLTFQTLIVLLLIVPSISRALFFVIAREVLDLHKLQLFEPRKAYHLTKKRLQNARFVWRIFPFMSPVLTYLPLLLLCQLLGKFYASVLVLIFMVSPIITAQYQTKPLPEQQLVKDWLIYSTVWAGLYLLILIIIVLVESLGRNQFSVVLKSTFQSWTWYVKMMADVCLAIVVTSDILYQFMASDAELEADSVINDYLEALEDQAQHMAVMQPLLDSASSPSGAASPPRLPQI